jgi:hypothetical protein
MVMITKALHIPVWQSASTVHISPYALVPPSPLLAMSGAVPVGPPHEARGTSKEIMSAATESLIVGFLFIVG